MKVRATLAALAVVALGAAPLANAQSISSDSLGSTAAETKGFGPNLGTTPGDRSVGCSAEWVAQTINSRQSQDNDYFKSLDGTVTPEPSNAGYVYEMGADPASPGDLLLHHWFGATTAHWRLPVATTIDINDAVLTLEFEGDTFAEAPTDEDVSAWFSTREEAFSMPDYDWDLPHPEFTVSGNAADGFTLTYELGDLEADSALGIQLAGPVAADLASQTATATLTGTFPVGTASCTPLQSAIGGTPLGSLSGSLAGFGS